MVRPVREDGKPLCVHCGRRRRNRPRGLCWTCYRAPAVQAAYPGNPPPVGSGNPVHRLPGSPTDARPGSEAKMAVMAARAARGECLFHPADVRFGCSVRDILAEAEGGAA